jgi:hypothetical protein
MKAEKNTSIAEKIQKIINGLGLTFKIIAIFMFCSALLGLVMYCVIAKLAGKYYSSNGFEQSLLLSFVFKHFAVLAVLQIVIAMGIFYSSLQFIKLRLWALNILEIFAWFFLGFIICYAGFNIAFLPSSSYAFKVISTAGIGFWAIPVLLLIWLLRKQEVRDTFKH